MSLSRKTLVVAVGTGVQSILAQIGLNLILVRVLDPTTFGTYRQAFLVMNTVFPMFLFGIQFSAYYYLPTLAPSLRRPFAQRCLLVLGVSGCLLAGLFILVAPIIAHRFSNPELTPLLRSFSAYALFSVPGIFLFHYFIAVDRPTRATVYSVAFMVLQSALTVVLVVAGQSLLVVIRALGAVALFRLIVSVFEIMRFAPAEGRTMADLPVNLRSHLAYALPVGITATVAIAGQKLDKFVVSSVLDAPSYAIYSVGALEFPLTMLISAAASVVMRPRMSQLHDGKGPEGVLGFWRIVVQRMISVMIPISIFLAGFSRPLIEFLYTPAYGPATPIFRIFLILTLFRLTPFEPLLASVGRARVVLAGGIVFLVLDLALNLILVRVMGILGPPWATVLATLAMTLIYGWSVREYLRVPVWRLVPGGRLSRTLLASLGALGLSLLVYLLHANRFVTLAAGGGLFALAYLGLGAAMGLVTRRDVAMVREFLPRRGIR
jgi:O-antigen/teichoic acid export membrane protein